VSFVEKTNIIVIHSDNCVGSASGRQLSCAPCERPQSLKFQDFIAWAKNAPEFTNWDYLNSQQLKALLKKLSGMCNDLQIKVRIFISLSFLV
jgi:hypothetical protein